MEATVILPDFDQAAFEEQDTRSYTSLDYRDQTVENYMVWKDYIVGKIEKLNLYHKKTETPEEYKKIEHDKLVIDIWLMFEDRARQAITATDEDEVTVCVEDMAHNFAILEHMAKIENNELAKELTDDCSQLRLMLEDIENHKVFDQSTRKFLGTMQPEDNPRRVVRFAV